MNIEGLKFHRRLSWVVALYSLIVIFLVNLRQLVEPYVFYAMLHLTTEWILFGILVIHCVLSQKYLKLWWDRIIKGLKSKRARPIYILRVIQLITNRIIIILAVLVILSGFGYFDWYDNTIGIVIPFEAHFYYDLFLAICIIIHISVGFKFMFIRRRIKHRSSNIFIVLFCISLILVIIFLKIFS